jgi:hypothetical protein
MKRQPHRCRPPRSGPRHGDRRFGRHHAEPGTTFPRCRRRCFVLRPSRRVVDGAITPRVTAEQPSLDVRAAAGAAANLLDNVAQRSPSSCPGAKGRIPRLRMGVDDHALGLLDSRTAALLQYRSPTHEIGRSVRGPGVHHATADSLCGSAPTSSPTVVMGGLYSDGLAGLHFHCAARPGGHRVAKSQREASLACSAPGPDATRWPPRGGPRCSMSVTSTDQPVNVG